MKLKLIRRLVESIPPKTIGDERFLDTDKLFRLLYDLIRSGLKPEKIDADLLKMFPHPIGGCHNLTKPRNVLVIGVVRKNNQVYIPGIDKNSLIFNFFKDRVVSFKKAIERNPGYKPHGHRFIIFEGDFYSTTGSGPKVDRSDIQVYLVK